MKKTLSIHFGRQLFIIEEDAYDQLQQYLKRLEISLQNDEGAAEIIEDIEMRFAELLLSYLADTRKVINPEDVARGISSLGEPEVIAEDESSSTEQQFKYSDKNEQSKRLFRDPEEGILGGICYGLATYLNIDPLIVRIIFILLLIFAGMPIPVYIILWLLLPVASTPSDRLRMKGKPVNIDSLKEEFERAADRTKSDIKNARDRFRSGTDPSLKRVSDLIRSIVKLTGLMGIAATFILMLFYGLFISGLVAIIPSTGDTDYLTFGRFLELVIPNQNTYTIVWITILTLGISGIVMSFIIGFRMLSGKTKIWLKPVLFANSILLFIGILTGIIGGIQCGRDFSVYTELEMQHLTVKADSLVVSEYSHYSNDKRVVATGGVDFIHLKNGKLSINGVLITYKNSPDSNFHIYQLASAHAVDRSKAIKRCEHIENICRLNGNVLIVDPMISFPAKDGYRNQEIEIVIEIPAGRKINVRGKEKHLGTLSSKTEGFRVSNSYEERN